MGQFGFGQHVPRTEDPRLFTGRGRYIADFEFPNLAYGYVMRWRRSAYVTSRCR